MNEKILSQLEDYKAFLARVEADAQAYIQGRMHRHHAESQTEHADSQTESLPLVPG
jgi:hypothetical protein